MCVFAKRVCIFTHTVCLLNPMLCIYEFVFLFLLLYSGTDGEILLILFCSVTCLVSCIWLKWAESNNRMTPVLRNKNMNLHTQNHVKSVREQETEQSRKTVNERLSPSSCPSHLLQHFSHFLLYNMSFYLGEWVSSSSDTMAKSRNEIEIERLNGTREKKTERSSCQ